MRRMLLPKQLVNEINNLREKLEEIAQSNQTTDSTADFLYNICENLNELAN